MLSYITVWGEHKTNIQLLEMNFPSRTEKKNSAQFNFETAWTEFFAWSLPIFINI